MDEYIDRWIKKIEKFNRLIDRKLDRQKDSRLYIQIDRKMDKQIVINCYA